MSLSSLQCQPKIWAAVGLLLSFSVFLSWGFPRFQNPDGGPEQKPEPVRSGICFDSLGRPYMEDIANPKDCSQFYKCTITNGSEPFYPEPVPQFCPLNLGLCFDIYTCRCEYCDFAVCFDPDDPVHNTDEVRFNCATMMEVPTWKHNVAGSGSPMS